MGDGERRGAKKGRISDCVPHWLLARPARGSSGRQSCRRVGLHRRQSAVGRESKRNRSREAGPTGKSGRGSEQCFNISVSDVDVAAARDGHETRWRRPRDVGCTTVGGGGVETKPLPRNSYLERSNSTEYYSTDWPANPFSFRKIDLLGVEPMATVLHLCDVHTTDSSRRKKDTTIHSESIMNMYF